MLREIAMMSDSIKNTQIFHEHSSRIRLGNQGKRNRLFTGLILIGIAIWFMLTLITTFHMEIEYSTKTFKFQVSFIPILLLKHPVLKRVNVVIISFQISHTILMILLYFLLYK